MFFTKLLFLLIGLEVPILLLMMCLFRCWLDFQVIEFRMIGAAADMNDGVNELIRRWEEGDALCLYVGTLTADGDDGANNLESV